MDVRCRVCGNESGNRIHVFLEMMFGTRESFEYVQCAICNCLQIAEVPTDLHKYYPNSYYSRHTVPSNTGFKRHLVNMRNRYAVFRCGIFGWLLFRFYPNWAIGCLSLLRVSRESRILEIGCGSGALLLELYDLGFRQLLGVDPFNEGDIDYPNGLRILKRDLADIEGQWDVVTFNHAFEHVANPLDTLLAVKYLLRVHGHCVLRIPTVSSFAWKHYREHWAQIDAPRHLFLHSVESIRILAMQAGLELEKVLYDSNEFQFWGSEQYRMGIPFTGSKSYAVNPSQSIFSRRQIADFRHQADQLNANAEGDQAVFVLRRAQLENENSSEQ